MAIPKHFFAAKLSDTLFMIGRTLLLWALSAACSVAVAQALMHNSPSWVALIAGVGIVAFCSFISAHGLQRLGMVGHDGTHFNLHPDKFTSALLGMAVAALVPFHVDIGFAVHHADHHRFTNTDRDPDAVLFSQFKSFWSRLFLARMAATCRYISTVFKLATRTWPADTPIHVGLSIDELVRLARLNILASAVVLSVYVGIGIAQPVVGVFGLLLPFLALVMISGLRPYIEHQGTGTDKLHMARTWASPLLDILYGDNNYHLAHHMYPGVPNYRLKAFHQWLQENGSLPSDVIATTQWSEVFKVTTLPYEPVPFLKPIQRSSKS